MATEIKSAPEDIREDSILQLIQHWQMEYQPAATVDPTSDIAVSGKAVYNFFKDNMNKVATADNVPDHPAGLAWIVPDSVIRSGQTYSWQKYVKVKFETSVEGVVENGLPPLFNNTIYDMNAYELASTVSINDFAAQPLTNVSTTLMWIFMNDTDSRIAYLYRNVTFIKVTYPGQEGYYLYFSPLRRSIVTNNGVQVNLDPTDSQKQRCTIKRMFFYI